MADDLKDSGIVTVLSVIGFVFGLLGMLGSFVPCFGAITFYIGIPAAIISGVALLIAHQQNAKKSFAIVALTISFIGIILSLAQYHAIKQLSNQDGSNLHQGLNQDQFNNKDMNQEEPDSIKVIDPKTGKELNN